VGIAEIGFAVVEGTVELESWERSSRCPIIVRDSGNGSDDNGGQGDFTETVVLKEVDGRAMKPVMTT